MTLDTIPIMFYVLALALAVICAVFLLGPLFVRQSDQAKSGHGVSWAVIFTLVSLIGSFWLYTQNSSWNWRENGVPENEAMAHLYELQKQVHENPTSAEKWSTLGQFYSSFSQLDAAADALDRAVRLADARDIDSNLLLAEVLTQLGRAQDQVRVHELINASLRVEPNNRKALWYGGEVAAAMGKFDVAIARWQILLDESKGIETPEAASVARLMQQRITSARERMNAPAGQAAAPEAVQVTVALPVDIEPPPGNTTVFVLARVFGQPGPPLAVHRATVAQLPLQATLTDQNAMMPGRTLSQFDDVEIVARIALGGQPIAQSGDWMGSQRLLPNTPRAVSLVLDKRVP